MMARESEDHGTNSIKAEPKSSSDIEYNEPAFVYVKTEPYDVEVTVCPTDSDCAKVIKIEPTEGYQYPTGVSPVKVDPADVAEDVRSPVAANVKKELDIELTVLPPPYLLHKKQLRKSKPALRANSIGFSHQRSHNTAGDQNDSCSELSSEKKAQDKQAATKTKHRSDNLSISKLKKERTIQPTDGQHSCNVCGKCFKFNSHAVRHMKTHSNDRPYSCDVCSKFFTAKCNLSKHMKTHSAEPKFSCDVCCSVFSSKCNLAMHLKFHDGERRHCCNVCSKRFTTRNNLSRHMFTHAAKRLYSCNICSKRFTLKTSVNRHLRVHTG